MNTIERLIKLFYTPTSVFTDIKENPDYKAMLYLGIFSIPLMLSFLILLSQKVIIPNPYRPVFWLIVGIIGVFGWMEKIIFTWIMATVLYYLILKNYYKLELRFSDLLVQTNYFCISYYLLLCAECINLSEKQSIVVDLGNSNNSWINNFVYNLGDAITGSDSLFFLLGIFLFLIWSILLIKKNYEQSYFNAFKISSIVIIIYAIYLIINPISNIMRSHY